MSRIRNWLSHLPSDDATLTMILAVVARAQDLINHPPV